MEYLNNCRYAHLTFWSRRWDQTPKFWIPCLRHSYCWWAYKILWGSQGTSDLPIFYVRKPILDVKTPKTSTSASAVCLIRIFTVCIQCVMLKFGNQIKYTTQQPLEFGNWFVLVISVDKSIWLKGVNLPAWYLGLVVRKSVFQGFRESEIKTSLLSYRDLLEN